MAVIHEHEAFLDSILQYTGGTEYLDLQNDLGQVWRNWGGGRCVCRLGGTLPASVPPAEGSLSPCRRHCTLPLSWACQALCGSCGQPAQGCACRSGGGTHRCTSPAVRDAGAVPATYSDPPGPPRCPVMKRRVPSLTVSTMMVRGGGSWGCGARAWQGGMGMLWGCCVGMWQRVVVGGQHGEIQLWWWGRCGDMAGGGGGCHGAVA